MDLKEKIATLRAMKGMTQAELANAVGVTRKSIVNYENGDRTPKKEILLKLAKALQVEYTELVTDEEDFLVEAKDKYGVRGKAAAERLVHNANALFAGGELSEQDKAAVLEAIQEAYWQSKLINKKYTPKKFRNDKTEENLDDE